MIKQSLLVLLTALASTQALASAKCEEHPEAERLHPLEMQKKIVNEYGFAIKKFQNSGNCYEIYGWGLNDDKSKYVQIEVYFDTKTGAIVKKEIED
ncbi:PepSY domain-containing protein [Parathalassolituus penaei]|uniref:PepSY domain-containing protein n=1 Tax=Parathalassolituus penaei TaxID=2997323 RepID=A0A9X3EFB3_9GAMM|nr:PepSY domain-containing protein [Parathalassolituus penaei]MCY0966195.1 PepSY domain-containing protein [Parathalassolituus penaei]